MNKKERLSDKELAQAAARDVMMRRDKKRAVSVLIELQQTPIRLDIASISKLPITKESYE